MMFRNAISGIQDHIELMQIYADEKDMMRAHGESFDVVYVEGEPFRPDGPPVTKKELRTAVLAKYAEKNERR